MKIEIELLNEPSTYKIQMLAVDKYIKNNTLKTETIDFLGLTISEVPTIKETVKGIGVKVELDKYLRKFHVSCNKTKGGIYKFKVWNA